MLRNLVQFLQIENKNETITKTTLKLTKLGFIGFSKPLLRIGFLDKNYKIRKPGLQ